jgi:hypothetical protein
MFILWGGERKNGQEILDGGAGVSEGWVHVHHSGLGETYLKTNKPKELERRLIWRMGLQ